MTAGRKKEFNQELALQKAMEIFWQNGYSGTSLSDLTAGMNINKPSLYATFGNKEELFLAAIRQYLTEHASANSEALNAEGVPLRERIRSSLLAVADLVSNSDLPKGCLMIMSLSEAAGDSLPEQAVAEIQATFNSTRDSIIEFFKNEQLTGNLAKEVSAKVLAGFYMTQQMGLASLGRQGIPKKELKPIIEQGLHAFPILD